MSNLRPITKEEKLVMTLKIQADKAMNEMLADLLDANFNGYVDIWPVIKVNKKKTVLEVGMRKLLSGNVPRTNADSLRFHVVPGKGCKEIKL